MSIATVDWRVSNSFTVSIIDSDDEEPPSSGLIVCVDFFLRHWSLCRGHCRQFHHLSMANGRDVFGCLSHFPAIRLHFCSLAAFFHLFSW